MLSSLAHRTPIILSTPRCSPPILSGAFRDLRTAGILPSPAFSAPPLSLTDHHHRRRSFGLFRRRSHSPEQQDGEGGDPPIPPALQLGQDSQLFDHENKYLEWRRGFWAFIQLRRDLQKRFLWDILGNKEILWNFRRFRRPAVRKSPHLVFRDALKAQFGPRLTLVQRPDLSWWYTHNSLARLGDGEHSVPFFQIDINAIINEFGSLVKDMQTGHESLLAVLEDGRLIITGRDIFLDRGTPDPDLIIPLPPPEEADRPVKLRWRVIPHIKDVDVFGVAAGRLVYVDKKGQAWRTGFRFEEALFKQDFIDPKDLFQHEKLRWPEAPTMDDLHSLPPVDVLPVRFPGADHAREFIAHRNQWAALFGNGTMKLWGRSWNNSLANKYLMTYVEEPMTGQFTPPERVEFKRSRPVVVPADDPVLVAKGYLGPNWSHVIDPEGKLYQSALPCMQAVKGLGDAKLEGVKSGWFWKAAWTKDGRLFLGGLRADLALFTATRRINLRKLAGVRRPVRVREIFPAPNGCVIQLEYIGEGEPVWTRSQQVWARIQKIRAAWRRWYDGWVQRALEREQREKERKEKEERRRRRREKRMKRKQEKEKKKQQEAEEKEKEKEEGKEDKGAKEEEGKKDQGAKEEEGKKQEEEGRKQEKAEEDTSSSKKAEKEGEGEKGEQKEEAKSKKQ